MKFRSSILWFVVGLAAAGCATNTSNRPPREAVSFPDVYEFRTRLGEVIQPGMSVAEVREFLLSEYPPPKRATEGASVHTRGPGPDFIRRFIMTWDTVNADESVVLTLFCDESYHVVRWVVGTLTEGPMPSRSSGGSSTSSSSGPGEN